MILSLSSKDFLKKVINHINAGFPIVFPTETLYGIGVSIKEEKNLKRLFEIKKGREDKPIALMCSSIEVAKKYLSFTRLETSLAEKFYPGPITMLLQRKKTLPCWYYPSFEKIGLRIPQNEIALKILSAFDDVLSVTSANFSNEKPALNANEANFYFEKFDDVLIVDGGDVEGKVPSTVFEIEEDEIKILREGPISKSDLERLKNEGKIL